MRERELEVAQAKANAFDLLDDLGCGIEVKPVLNDYTWTASLTKRSPRGDLIEGSGKGVRPEEAEIGAIFETIEHFSLVNYGEHASIFPVQARAILDKHAPGDLGVIEYILKGQLDASMYAAEFNDLSGKRKKIFPLGIHCPAYVHDCIDDTSQLKGEDVFDYSELRKYSSSNGMAAGSTLAEALVHAISEVAERQSVGEFLVKCVGAEVEKIRLNAIESLPVDLQRLQRRACESAGAEVYLIDLTGEAGIPTYLAYLDDEHPYSRCITMGSSLYPDYAVSRALTEMIQSVEVIRAATAYGGGTMAERTEKMFSRFRRVSYSGYERFEFFRLREFIHNGKFIAVNFSDQPPCPEFSSLDAHVVELCRRLALERKEVWYRLTHDWSDLHNVICIQAVLTPYDPSFLLMHGIPVAFSDRMIKAAANPNL